MLLWRLAGCTGPCMAPSMLFEVHAPTLLLVPLVPCYVTRRPLKPRARRGPRLRVVASVSRIGEQHRPSFDYTSFRVPPLLLTASLYITYLHHYPSRPRQVCSAVYASYLNYRGGRQPMDQKTCTFLEDGALLGSTRIVAAPGSALLARTGVLIAASHSMVVLSAAAFFVFVVLLALDT